MVAFLWKRQIFVIQENLLIHTVSSQEQSSCVLRTKVHPLTQPTVKRREKDNKDKEKTAVCTSVCLCLCEFCMFVKGCPVENSRHNRLLPAGFSLSMTAWLTSPPHLPHTHTQIITHQQSHLQGTLSQVGTHIHTAAPQITQAYLPPV